MPQLLRLSVPQSCSESWAAMTPAAQGRHCAACAKVVIDFTTLSDAEVVALLHRTAAPCGRFRSDQLQRVLRPLAEPAPRWRTWLAAAAAVLGLRELAAEQSVGQQPTASVYTDFLTQDQRKLIRHPQHQVLTDSMSQVVRGRVTDASTGDGLPGVTILIQGTRIGTSTNVDGTFELRLAHSYVLTPSTTLSISCIGYQNQDIRWDVLQQLTVPIELKMSTQALGEVVVTRSYYAKPWHPRSLWNRVRAPFR
ncbi:carboxypeptidase-like regulatory domain-containing protein [Hymenobacter yonginensis]|uniref:Carboxypeptidase-like regulatory domain-containing protein n=1 Tax=Hymenobacter yonginensis TaxID=748197 RepID=A0ABY7PLY5_9BACT|nr:carboxypeptidase-like regulatory domain-containing protein [Hymenobacter yonginensis]WBO84227.1 carboxypeptidase-like regulatory domain-containing protein [Hymenobacter yonginensis]